MPTFAALIKRIIMKRVNEYKKLFEIEKEFDLSSLKLKYRSLVKEWHPDKFPEGHELAEEAAQKSQKIIDAYHFLVSIAPETIAANKEAYTITTTETGIQDYKHKSMLLEVTFTDGSTYEYFGVTPKLFSKMINADNPYRFGKRNIFNTFLYRKSKRDLEPA